MLNTNYHFVIALGLISFIVSMDMLAINQILPTLSTYFQADLSSLRWLITSYSIVSSALIILLGKFGDLYGARNMLLGGVIILSIGSLMTVFATDVFFLILSRCLQGVGHASVLALQGVLLQQLYKEESLANALGLVASMGAMAVVLGPILIAVLLKYSHWQSVFLLNIPICFWVFYQVRLRSDNQILHVEQCVDIFGAVLFILAFIGILLVLTMLPLWGWKHQGIWQGMFFSFMLFSFFRIHQNYSAEPLISPVVLRDSLFKKMSIVRLIVSSAMFSVLFISVLCLEHIYHFTSLKVGFIFCVISCLMVIAAALSGTLIRYMHPLTILMQCAAVLAVFFAWMAYDPLTNFSWLYICVCLLAGLALGLIRPVISYIILRIVPENFRGVSQALSASSVPLGACLGVTITTLCLVNINTKYLNGLLHRHNWHPSPETYHWLVTTAQGLVLPRPTHINAHWIDLYQSLAHASFVYAYQTLMLYLCLGFIVMFLLCVKARVKGESLCVK